MLYSGDFGALIKLPIHIGCIHHISSHNMRNISLYIIIIVYSISIDVYNRTYMSIMYIYIYIII